VAKSEKDGLIPKNLFNTKASAKSLVKEQKINIIGGKKRITPILLSPRKSLKTEKKSSKKVFSSEMELLE